MLNAPPVAAGSADPEETDRLTDVHFTDASTDPDGQVVAWRWDFGDGTSSTEQNPTHRYTRLGTMKVSLEVTDNDGATASAEVAKVKVKNIKPRPQLQGDGGHGPDAAIIQANRVDPVQFTDESSDPDGTVEAWAWDFGDGATSTAQHPSHQYTQLGSFPAELTATDNDGDSELARATVNVVNLLPSASFTVKPHSPTVFLPATFDSTAADLDGSVASYHWSFGDGATSGAADPVHAYLNGGLYDVVLSVTDNDGGQVQVRQTVFVCAPGLDLSALVEGLEHVRLEFESCLRLNGETLGSMPGPGELGMALLGTLVDLVA